MNTEKGMIVNVYRTPGQNCTNGPSGHYNRVLLVGSDIPQLFEAGDMPVMRLVRRRLFGREHLHVEPITQAHGNRMFGGNFVYSSDSRFPSPYPIGIHDREENNYYGVD